MQHIWFKHRNIYMALSRGSFYQDRDEFTSSNAEARNLYECAERGDSLALLAFADLAEEHALTSLADFVRSHLTTEKPAWVLDSIRENPHLRRYPHYGQPISTTHSMRSWSKRALAKQGGEGKW